MFRISQSTGVISLVGSLDYESLAGPKHYEIRVLAIDGGTPTAKTVHFVFFVCLCVSNVKVNGYNK